MGGEAPYQQRRAPTALRRAGAHADRAVVATDTTPHQGTPEVCPHADSAPPAPPAPQSGRRSIKANAQAAWLLRAITCMDLTTLAGDDTAGNVARLCAKARRPVRTDILEALGVEHLPITTAAVCVYPARVSDAVSALRGTNLGVAAVATGFPSGQIKTEQKLDEIRGAVADGATEIDIVLSRDLALRGEWAAVYEEVSKFREACGDAHMKTILAVSVDYLHLLCRRPCTHRKFDHATDRRSCNISGYPYSVDGVHDGWGRLHQDFDRQRDIERNSTSEPGDGSLHPRVPAAHHENSNDMPSRPRYGQR
eukprot:COSAG05_NODE_567_length_8639_cov_20.845082_1_plen_309_part_00